MFGRQTGAGLGSARRPPARPPPRNARSQWPWPWTAGDLLPTARAATTQAVFSVQLSCPGLPISFLEFFSWYSGNRSLTAVVQLGGQRVIRKNIVPARGQIRGGETGGSPTVAALRLQFPAQRGRKVPAEMW